MAWTDLWRRQLSPIATTALARRALGTGPEGVPGETVTERRPDPAAVVVVVLVGAEFTTGRRPDAAAAAEEGAGESGTP